MTQDHPEPAAQPPPRRFYGAADPELGPPVLIEPEGRGWRQVLIIYVVPVLAVVAVLVVGNHFRSSGSPRFPKSWDPRVLPSVQFVEKERGLTFNHPIYVDFMSDSDFRRKIVGASSGTSDAQTQASNDQAAELRALGLVDGNLDFGAADSSFRGDSVLGLYSFATQRIAMRGKALTLASTTTLVHELTHALDDQAFSIGKLGADIPNADDQADAFLDLVEGDARRIEDAYLASLTPSQRATEAAEDSAGSKAATQAAKSIPSIIEVDELAPYVLGPQFLGFLHAVGGDGALNHTFTDLPTTSMEIVQPWRYEAGAGSKVTVPDAPAAGTTIRSGTFGEFKTYLVLADKLGPAAAMRAVQGWDGDHFVTYRQGSQTCVVIAYQADSTADSALLYSGFNAWADAMPGHSVVVDDDADGAETVRVLTCDPGPNGKHVARNQAVFALQIAQARLSLAVDMVKSGLTANRAACASGQVAAKLTAADIAAGRASAAVKALVTKAEQACR